MKFRVVHHLKRDGKEYGPGESINLTELEATQCGSAVQPWSADEAAERAEKRKAVSRGVDVDGERLDV